MTAPPLVLRPRALQPGDTVAVAALSGPLETAEVELYERGVAVIESFGLRVRPAPLVGLDKAWWWGAATPTEVAAEFNALLRDPDVRAIWALTGGRFALSYLDRIDYAAVAADPKPILGMSDVDALLLAIHAMTGLATVHADLVTVGLGEWRDLDDPVQSQWWDVYRRVLGVAEPAGPLPQSARWEAWREGRATGRLIGGMLNRLIRVQATPQAVPPERFDGAILFWEDIGTSSLAVWNDLHVLRQAGVFDRIAGMLVGARSTIETPRVLAGPTTLRDVVMEVVGDRDLPVIANVDIGHAGPNLPLPLGIAAEIDAGALTIWLNEAAVAPS